MLEALINEDQETAKEIFHNIVVAKSREIYEELLSEDFEAGDTGNPYAQEAFGDDEEDDSEGEPADDEADDADMGDDSEDDSEDEMDFGDEEGDEEGSMDDAEQSDRILDLEDALEELKAEFEQLMAGEEGEEHMGGDDMGDMDVMPEEGDDMMAMEPMEGDDELMLEYKNKVPAPKHGDNGQNTKSIVAKPNRMGGANMMAGSREESGNGGTKGGLLNPSTKEENFGNVNVPGGNAGKTAFKKKEPGHGAERKGSPAGQNVGAETGKNSRDGEKNTNSMLNGAPNRAK
jgi:hypothetical protein